MRKIVSTNVTCVIVQLYTNIVTVCVYWQGQSTAPQEDYQRAESNWSREWRCKSQSESGASFCPHLPNLNTCSHRCIVGGNGSHF